MTFICTQNALLGYDMNILQLQQGFSVVAESLDRFIERTSLFIIICLLCRREVEVGKEVWFFVCPEFEPSVAWSHMLKVFATWDRYNSGSRSLIGGGGLSCMEIDWH
jgi:hypothetical protein